MAVSRIKLAAFLVTLCAVYAVSRHVVYFGDDYWFTGYWGKDFFETFYKHYTTETGRIMVNIFGMLFVAAPEVWKLANSVMLALIVLLGGSIALGESRDALRAVAVYAVLIAGVLLLDADITRQSVYWISGSVNYVLPYLLFTLLWWGFVKIKKRRTALLTVIAFFAGCSTEQAGMMSLGLCALYCLNETVIKRKKISKEHIIPIVAAIIGLSTIVFAPATRVRFGLESAGDFTSTGALVRYNLEYMLRYFTQSPYTLFAQVFILLSTGFFIFRHSNGKLGKVLGVLSLPLAAALSILLLRGTSGVLYTAFIWTMRAYYAASGLLVLHILLRRKLLDDYIVPAALALGSQLMMLISPAIGPRTMLCALLLVCVYAAYLLRVSIGGIKKSAVLLCSAALMAISGFKLINTVSGYRATEEIHRENEAIIAAYTGSGYRTKEAIYRGNEAKIEAHAGSDKLVLYKFTNAYCWSEPYRSAFHETCYKRHYGLAEDTVIVWEDYGV